MATTFAPFTNEGEQPPAAALALARQLSIQGVVVLITFAIINLALLLSSIGTPWYYYAVQTKGDTAPYFYTYKTFFWSGINIWNCTTNDKTSETTPCQHTKHPKIDTDEIGYEDLPRVHGVLIACIVFLVLALLAQFGLGAVCIVTIIRLRRTLSQPTVIIQSIYLACAMVLVGTTIISMGALGALPTAYGKDADDNGGDKPGQGSWDDEASKCEELDEAFLGSTTASWYRDNERKIMWGPFIGWLLLLISLVLGATPQMLASLWLMRKALRGWA